MGDLTNVTQPNDPSTNYSAADAVRAVMAQLVSCWPNAKFDRKDTTGAWATAIGGLSGNQVRHGITELSLLASGWPPSPGEFRALCRTYRPPEQFFRAALPDKSARAEAERDEIRRKAGELAQSLRLQIPPPAPPPEALPSRSEQGVCEHEWKPHQYYGGEYCVKCNLAEAEIESMRIHGRVQP